MRVKTFFRMLRIIAAVTLFFFVWSFLPLWQAVAYAAEPERQGARGQGSGGSADRFEKALDAIRENVSRAGDKADKGEDDAKEREIIKTGKAEIESADSEFKKEFAATEKKLKDAKLPKEILARHYKFVKHYEDNLKELRTNLDDVDKAKTKTDRKAKIAKTKAHLEKTKTPSKHVPLDPNKLPHRMVKGKERAPRLKQEQFERDFPQHRTKSKQKIAASRLLPDLLTSRAQHKPVLLAFNEFASDIPLSLGIQPAIPQLAFSDPSPFLFAQAAVQPTVDDLAETPEVQFTDTIRAKAQELGCSPVRIYEEIRNSIEFVPTYGSIQGADMCLQTKQCNATDTSSLLISLLRSCNIPAHYVYSTVEIPIDKAMNWVGGFTDPKAAITFISSGGIPIKAYASGGVLNKIQMEHVSVETYVPYGPYSGRSSNLNVDKMWVPLDPSFKLYTYTEGVDLQTAVPFDAQAFADQIQSTATISETAGFITNVDSNYIQATMTDYQTQIQNYIDQNMPNATTGDIIGKKEIKKQELGILPVTLPYKTITIGTKYSETPDNLRHKVTFEVQDSSATGNSLSYTTSIPEIAGKRVTLSYAPATAADELVINNHGGIFNVPAYLVAVKSQIKVEGVTMANGNSIGLGNQQTFNMKFMSPSGAADSIVSNNVTVGAYYGIGINPNKISKDLLEKRKAKLENAYNTVCNNNMFGDECVGELLFITAATYFYELNIFDDIFAKSNKVADLRHVSEGIVTKDINVSTVWGMPLRTTEASFMIDVDRIIHSAVALNGDQSKERNFTISAGQVSSALENGIFEQLYQAQGVSTVKLLKVASDQGIPIFTINQNNIAIVLPKLSISTDVLMDIQNAVNAGKTVTVSAQNINYYGWTGVGYIVMDPLTGSAAYMISANLSGGGQCVTAAGGAANHCLLIMYEIWHFLDTLAAIVAFPTIALFALVGAVTEIGFAGIAIALGLSLLTIVIGAIIAITVIYIIKTLIEIYTASIDDNRRLYTAKRGKHGFLGC